MLQDKFGRDLNAEQIRLVDWDGYMANPAIELSLKPLPSVPLPITVTITADHPRLYFNMPSVASATGPSKSVTFFNANPQYFFLSIFPDREGGDEAYTLTVSSSQGTQTFDIAVADYDTVSPPVDFDIILDFSKDNAYNFFDPQINKDIAIEAADDWAYFIEDMNFDLVPAVNEWTFIWNDNYQSGNWTQNTSPYSGFLVYGYGIHVDPHISGGGPSLHAFQTINGVATGLRRSGGYNADPHGNYNDLGWNTSIVDDTWYQATNLGNVPNDLYSIALHEIGHALCFNPGHTIFQTYKNQGFVNDPAVVAYYGGNVPVNASDHLSDGTLLVDPISKKGLFGSEYASTLPYGRWLITKLNLMVLDAIGYNVKQTAAFWPVTLAAAILPGGQTGQPYNVQLPASGGVPFYKFEILSGNLPDGLFLDSFTGSISGQPQNTGTFSFTAKVTDYDNKNAQQTYNIVIGEECPLELALNANPIPPGIYNAANEISSTGSVANTTDVTFQAGTAIDLQAGFEVSLGGIFAAIIQGCVP